MPHGVHTAVNTVQPVPRHAPLDLAPAQSERIELSACDDPMLPPRKVRDRPIAGVLRRLCTHTVHK